MSARTGFLKKYDDTGLERLYDETNPYRRELLREAVYLEHFGMLDDAGYVEGVSHKLDTYEKNDICLGVNLFITHETKKIPLNTRALDVLLRKLFHDSYRSDD